MRFLSFILCAVISMGLYDDIRGADLERLGKLIGGAISGNKINGVIGAIEEFIPNDSANATQNKAPNKWNETSGTYNNIGNNQKKTKSTNIFPIGGISTFMSRENAFLLQDQEVFFSPSGRNAAYLDTSTGTVNILETSDSFAKSIDGYYIVQAVYLNEDTLAFVCIKNDNRIHLVEYDLINDQEKKDIIPMNYIESIKILCKTDDCLAIYIKANGRYFLANYHIKNGEFSVLMQCERPFIVKFDKKTATPALVIEIQNSHEIKGPADVYIIQNGNKQIFDKIDLDTCRYMGCVVNNDGTITTYKVVMQKEKNQNGELEYMLVSSKYNSRSGFKEPKLISDVGIKGISDALKEGGIGIVKDVLDNSGDLVALYFTKKNGENVFITFKGEDFARNLEQTFSNVFFERIEPISDNMYLIIEEDPEHPRRFWLYKDRNRTRKRIFLHDSEKNRDNFPILETKLMNVPNLSGPIGVIKSNQCAYSSNDKVVLICVGEDLALFNSLGQLLASRGVDVILVPSLHSKNDIDTLINWINSKFERNDKIKLVLFGKNESALKMFKDTPQIKGVIINFCNTTYSIASRLVSNLASDNRPQLYITRDEHDQDNRRSGNLFSKISPKAVFVGIKKHPQNGNIDKKPRQQIEAAAIEYFVGANFGINIEKLTEQEKNQLEIKSASSLQKENVNTYPSMSLQENSYNRSFGRSNARSNVNVYNVGG